MKFLQAKNLVELHVSHYHSSLIPSALFFSYDYHPGAENLDAKHFNQSNELIPESTLWSYIIQLLSLLRTVHNAGLACRILVPSKILVTGRNRYQRFKLLSPVKNPFELRRNL